MAYHAAKSLKLNQPNPDACASDCTVILAHPISVDLASGDILEMGVLPPNCTLVAAELLSEGITETATIDVGLMSGIAYEDNDARTSGAELFDGVANDAAHAAGLKGLKAIAAAETPRGIGLAFSAAITAGAGKNVWLKLTYIA